MIDLATLTGAARVALGAQLPALFCRRMELARALVDRGLALHDPLWHLPLWKGYHAGIESEIADLVNTGRNALAGAINAALFLEDFVPADLDWLHIDLFAWNDTARPGRPVGGEGQTLRTLLDHIERRFVPLAARPEAACPAVARRALRIGLDQRPRHLLEFADRSVEECRQPGTHRCASGLAGGTFL